MKISLNVLKNATRNTARVISRGSPAILSGLAVAGTITTAVLAYKAAPKAQRLVDEFKSQHKENDVTKEEKIQLAKDLLPVLAPMIIMGAATVACIIGSSAVNKRRLTALSAAYTLAEANWRGYENKVKEIVGDKKADIIKSSVAQESMNDKPLISSDIIMTGNGSVLCYEPYSARYFRSSPEYVKQAALAIKSMMYDSYNNMATLNNLYDELGLDTTKCGDEYGWDCTRGDKIDIELTATLSKLDEPCLVINTNAGYLWGD